ncbi:MAG TPA: SAM-dependent methyltransferase, partial [Bdellovibrionales bacterium]|nr:SAM-dependent methyltransferase [Bdellovibrionales bacterium]
MDGVAKTSLLTAAMRAAESKRIEDRLFNDPYAELLAGAEGASLREKAIAESGDQPAIAIRTAFIDKKVTDALKDGVRQIVMLAAGMDTRAYRLDFPEGVRLFELDRKEVFDYKHEKLQGVKSKCERKTLAVDLRDEWQSQLVQAGFKPKERTLWLVEGLLMYLEESQVEALFNRINTLASPKDVMLFDILTRTLIEAPYMEKQLKFLESMGAPWRFGVNEPEEFMKKFGWDAHATQAGEFAPTRWPFPTAPRNVPNVPRGFYM